MTDKELLKLASKEITLLREENASLRKIIARRGVYGSVAEPEISKKQGQSGPPITIKFSELNPKERAVLHSLRTKGVQSLDGLAGIFALDGERANSQVRNSLRRLVRGGFVRRIGIGFYEAANPLTPKK